MYLHCPKCYSNNNIRKKEIMNAVCTSCGCDLYAYYFVNKTDDKSTKFIWEETQRIKHLAKQRDEQRSREYAEKFHQEEAREKRGMTRNAALTLVFGVVAVFYGWDYVSDNIFGTTVEYAIVDGKEYELGSYKIIPPKRNAYRLGPKQQKVMRDLIETTKSSIPSDANDVLKKRTWINASRQLCTLSAFDAFAPKTNWFGYVSHISMDDDGDVGLILRIDGHDNTVFDGDVPNRLENILLRLNEGDIVRFSGRFKKGKSSENECLRAGYTSSPELYDETFMFDFTQIEKIEVKKVKVEKN